REAPFRHRPKDRRALLPRAGHAFAPRNLPRNRPPRKNRGDGGEVHALRRALLVVFVAGAGGAHGRNPLDAFFIREDSLTMEWGRPENFIWMWLAVLAAAAFWLSRW